MHLTKQTNKLLHSGQGGGGEYTVFKLTLYFIGDDISDKGYFKKLFALTEPLSVIADIYSTYFIYVPFHHCVTFFPVRFQSADKKVSFKDRAD